MNLHMMAEPNGWKHPHVSRHYGATGTILNFMCSECGPVTRRGPTTHLMEEHGIQNTALWVCECRDTRKHNGRTCGAVCAGEDVNVDERGREMPNPTYPYIFICPDCRTHNHGKNR